MIDRSYYLAFSNFSGIGPIKFEKLIREFSTAEKAWNSSTSDLKVLLGEKLTSKFEIYKKEFSIEAYEESLTDKKISYVCLNEKEYSSLLKKIPNPPIVLYLKGNLQIANGLLTTAVDGSLPAGKAGQKADSRLLAIVGTRRITAYGKSVTELFSSELAAAGLVIVSGLALGVDGVAHTACLDSKGKTIAVLGNGVDMCYPRENQKIYDRILAEGGVIISEFPPGQLPSVGSFPSRNRIVAGLSDGVLVTEGASDSGSLITANYGLDFGRKVFAVPGPITSSLSAAPLRLIEKGAVLVVSPEDILRNFQLSISNFQSNKNNPMYKKLNKDERSIIELIENEPLQFDEIVNRLKIDSSQVGSLLSMMEMKGILTSSNGNFSLKK